MSRDRNEAPDRRALVRPIVLWPAQCLVLFLTHLKFPGPSAAIELDPSWRQAYNHFFTHDFQAGVDYVFTMGPWGFLHSPIYSADVFWVNYFVQSALVLLMAGILVAFGARLKQPLAVLAYWVVILFVLPFATRDGIYVCALIAFTVLLFPESRWRRYVLPLFAAFVAFVGLIKFSFFVVGILCLGTVGIHLLWQGGRAKAILLASAYFGFVVGFWLLANQSIANLPVFIYSSVVISRGYNLTMMLPGRIESEIPVALLAITCLVLGTFVAVYKWKEDKGGWLRLVKLAFFFAFLLVIWKNGFMRQEGHARLFFAVLAFVPFAIRIPREGAFRWCAVVLLAATYVTALGGYISTTTHGRNPDAKPSVVLNSWAYIVRTNGEILLNPGGEKTRLDASRAALLETYGLPKIAAIVEDSTVDALSHRQGQLLLNGINYRPRPVFQSHLAATPELSGLNASFFSGERAPDYVLMSELTAIDGRFPAGEDPDVVLAILRDYRFVMLEEDVALFQRVERSPDNPSGILIDRVIPLAAELRFGEWMPILDQPGSWQLLMVTGESSLPGKLRTILFRPPFTYMECRFSDGEVERRRVPILPINGAFLLNPYIDTWSDLLSAQAGGGKKHIAAVRFLTEPGGERFFVEPLHVQLRTVEPDTVRGGLLR